METVVCTTISRNSSYIFSLLLRLQMFHVIISVYETYNVCKDFGTKLERI